MEKSIDELTINTLRFLAIDAVEKANSGHPGMPMGDAPMAYVLWNNFLSHSPNNPDWLGRDRFVLSAGHGSMLLYSLLHLSGYPLTLDDLKDFRQWGSKTPGHPEYDIELGIETTTGPLGQGFATGVGMAMAEKYLAERYNKDGFDLFDYNIYAITSDGDIMEGVTSEAASLAGHLGLGKLVYLYSDNKITIEGSTDISFTEDVAGKFDGLGWHTQSVDGNDLDAIDEAIKAAKAETKRPSIILSRTNIGFGSPGKQDSSDSHGAPLGAEEVRLTKEKLGWPQEPSFYIPGEVKEHAGRAAESGDKLYGAWRESFDEYKKSYPELASEIESLSEGEKPGGWEGLIPSFTESDGPVATRSVSGKVLNAVAESMPYLLGGSADLGPSNNTTLKGCDSFTTERADRNIHFGVREHAMGSVINGMALSGILTPYCGTFLVFSDYMRPAIRLAALMGLKTTYVFTHDSIGLGEDGPTHQPVEHLAALRVIPGLTVMRPADANETAAAWHYALGGSDGPVALALTRQKVPVLEGACAEGVTKGGYVLSDPDGSDPDFILIATGSEVHLALEAQDALSAQGLRVRVVSMPSFDLFEAQTREYRDSVLPPSIKARLAIEAGSSFGWCRYVGDGGAIISIDRFGASAPAKINFEKFGFTVENIKAKALELTSLAGGMG